jgi:hypothetical protein
MRTGVPQYHGFAMHVIYQRFLSVALDGTGDAQSQKSEMSHYALLARRENSGKSHSRGQLCQLQRALKQQMQTFVQRYTTSGCGE